MDPRRDLHPKDHMIGMNTAAARGAREPEERDGDDAKRGELRAAERRAGAARSGSSAATSTASCTGPGSSRRASPTRRSAGRPVIGICNSWSELVNCNVHLRGLAESVKRGVLQAGGFPLEFPVMSLGESLMKPTTMLYRNLMAMDVEESIRSYPLDGVVLLTGCDKTNPARDPRRREREHPVDRRHRRPDAERPLARPRARLVQRLLALPRGAPRRSHHARRSSSRSRTRCPARTGTA